MKQMICLSTQPWSNTPARTQQLAGRLRGAEILYIFPDEGRWNPFLSPRERLVRPGVTTCALPPPFPLSQSGYPLFHDAHWRGLGRRIARIAARHGFQKPLVWATSPRQVHLLEYLDYGGLVYDCHREWDDQDPLWEGRLASAADLVLCASPGLADRLSPCSDNIAVVHNGANAPLFSHASQAQAGGRPTLGWAGTLHRDLDLAPLLHAARQQPDWQFLLLGAREAQNPFLPRLQRLDNVRLLDRLPLTEVPERLAACHVLLDFQRASQAGSDVISTRIFEYLCTGKPIVTMLLPDQVEPFPDMVYAAHNPEEFLTLCRHALEESPGWVTDRRRRYGQEAAWSARAGEVHRILTTAGLL